MSLYRMYAEKDELKLKADELFAKLEKFSESLGVEKYKKVLIEARTIENYSDLHFWHEEHMQVSLGYENISQHISDHMSISGALKNFITVLQIQGLTSENIDYFNKKVKALYLEHYNRHDKEFFVNISNHSDLLK